MTVRCSLKAEDRGHDRAYQMRIEPVNFKIYRGSQQSDGTCK